MTENLNEFSERLDEHAPVKSGLDVGQPGLALPRPLLHLCLGPILDCKRREWSRAAAGGGLQTRTLKQLKQAHTAGKGGPASHVSRQSDVFTKNKMMQQRKAAQRQDELDAQSVITQERLRKFNDIQGTVAGNVTDEIAAQDEFKQDLLEAG